MAALLNIGNRAGASKRVHKGATYSTAAVERSDEIFRQLYRREWKRGVKRYGRGSENADIGKWKTRKKNGSYWKLRPR